MYFCPGWDYVFSKELDKIKDLNSDFFYIRNDGSNSGSYLKFDCGEDN